MSFPKNGAVSRVDKKLISHPTRTQHTLSAARSVKVSHALPAVRFRCLLRGRGTSFQGGVAAGEGFLCDTFEVCRPVITAQREFRVLFKNTLFVCGASWTVPANDSVCCACVGWEIHFLITFETAPFFCVFPLFYKTCQRKLSRSDLIFTSFWKGKEGYWESQFWRSLVRSSDSGAFASQCLVTRMRRARHVWKLIDRSQCPQPVLEY
jgi:hypothetical protein